MANAREFIYRSSVQDQLRIAVVKFDPGRSSPRDALFIIIILSLRPSSEIIIQSVYSNLARLCACGCSKKYLSTEKSLKRESHAIQPDCHFLSSPHLDIARFLLLTMEHVSVMEKPQRFPSPRKRQIIDSSEKRQTVPFFPSKAPVSVDGESTF